MFLKTGLWLGKWESWVEYFKLKIHCETGRQMKDCITKIKSQVWLPMCVCSVTSVMSDSLRPMDCSTPDPSVHGILQTRILKRIVISFPRGSSQPRDQTQVSCIAGELYHWTTREALYCLYVLGKSLSLWKLQFPHLKDEKISFRLHSFLVRVN